MSAQPRQPRRRLISPKDLETRSNGAKQETQHSETEAFGHSRAARTVTIDGLPLQLMPEILVSNPGTFKSLKKANMNILGVRDSLPKNDREEKDALSINTETILRSLVSDLMSCVRHYNVSPEQCDAMIRQIEDWYRKQPHLPEGQMHKKVIIRHLITKSFSVERVKEKIDNYYTAKLKMPEFLKNRDPLSPSIDKIMMEGFWIVFPKRTSENHRVTLLRINKPATISVIDLIKVAFMIGDYRLRNDSAVGDHWMLDFKNIAFQHALQMNPVIISKVAFYLNSCLTPKLKGMHIVNMPAYAETVLNLFKRTMKSKLLKRIHLYNDIQDAMKEFPKEIVPRDFGGEEVSCDEIAESWRKTLQCPAWRQWFISQDAATTNEAKRVNSNSDLYGLDGSFKKLDID